MEEHGTWLHFLYAWHIVPEWVPEMALVTCFIVLVFSLVAIISSRSLVTKNPSRYQAALEFIVSSLDNFVSGIVGKEASKTATPIVGTIFIFIFTMNMFGVLPGFISPTANINTTVALALFAIVLVQYYGIKAQGVHYFKHFLGEPLWLAPLMLPIHIIGEIAKPLSLSIRLFGNVYGEEMVITVLMMIAITVLGKYLFPIQFPMVLFSVFTGFVQAFVFSMLVSIYVSIAIADAEGH